MQRVHPVRMQLEKPAFASSLRRCATLLVGQREQLIARCAGYFCCVVTHFLPLLAHRLASHELYSSAHLARQTLCTDLFCPYICPV